MGAVVVQHRTLTRSSRIRLYDDLLPTLIAGVSRPIGHLDDEKLAELIRAGTLAGRHERRATRAIRYQWEKGWAECMQLASGKLDQATGQIVGNEQTPCQVELSKEVLAELEKLHSWLEAKIR